MPPGSWRYRLGMTSAPSEVVCRFHGLSGDIRSVRRVRPVKQVDCTVGAEPPSRCRSSLRRPSIVRQEERDPKGFPPIPGEPCQPI